MKTLSFSEMERIAGGAAKSVKSSKQDKINNWGCNMGMGTAGAVLSTVMGVVSVGVGFAVAIGWTAFQTWTCS